MNQSLLKECLHYDPETGLFRWLKTSRKHTSGEVAGSINRYGKYRYIIISLFGKQYLGHRLAYLWMAGRMPSLIDHKNNNGTDNRWSNIREATRSQNRSNSKSKLKYKGAYRHGDGWRAQINFNQKIIRLGQFKNRKDAHLAYSRAAKKLFGEFARIN